MAMMNDYERIAEENRQKNKIKMEQFLAEYYKVYPELKIEAERNKIRRESEPQKQEMKLKRRWSEDPSYATGQRRKLFGSTPTRRSKRISLKDSKTEYESSEGEEEEEEEEEEEKVKVKPERRKMRVRRSNSSVSRLSQEVPVIPVENITDEMLSKIARTGKMKVWCTEKGTSCHQCRQKTMDTKSVCRSGVCTGVRGMFCGICLMNRYGEDVAVVLKDPTWKCPPCRGDCNCSICRTRQGKTPTGVMVPFIQEKGYSNLREYLEKNEEDDM